MANKKQWQKRVDVTQFIFSQLIKSSSCDDIKKESLSFDYDANQLKVIEYFANNLDSIIKEFSSNLGTNWTWDRIALMQQAIMIEAYCEVKALDRQIPIAVDQALVTADKYGQTDGKKFINAILDKILKNKK